LTTGTKQEQYPDRRQRALNSMSPDPQPQPDQLELATDQAIAACGGDARQAVKALIVANEYLEQEVCELMRAVSHAYLRGRFKTYTGWVPWPKSPISWRYRSSPVTTVWRLASQQNAFNPNAAIMRAEALSRKEGHVGAVAFSRTGDTATGDFSDAKVIRKFGDMPDDLSTLWWMQ
jgi:hypothetical protein